MGEKILLFGGGSHAIVTLEMLRQQGREVAFIFDPMLDRPYFPFAGAFGNDEQTLTKFLAAATDFMVCIGNEHGFARVKIAETLKGRYGLRPLDLVSAKAIVDPSATYGEGVQITSGSLLHQRSRVGAYSILNSKCTVDHDCVLGKGVHLMGASVVTARVTIGDFATIGANATIVPDLNIGEAAFVGAAAVVLDDVPPYTIVVGNPARKLRTREPVCEMSIFDNI